MYNSIQHFLTDGIAKIENGSNDFFEKPEEFFKFILNVKDGVVNLGIAIIAEEFERMDEMIRNSSVRKQKWVIVRRDETSLITSLGTVRYHKTLFKNKKTGRRCYIIDELMKLKPHERVTPDAIAEMLDEASETSYRRGGEFASLTDDLSKQTVKNVIHNLEFPNEEPAVKRKKVKRLYVNADEDHVALQFKENKGDLEPAANGTIYNNCLSKLVYVYEDCVPEAPKSKRNKLVNPRYFSGVYDGTEANRKLWKEVAEYINSHYEIEESGHIFVMGDGGAWIDTAKHELGSNVVLVLDKFHFMKYVNMAVSHMEDSKEDARNQLIELCRKKVTIKELDDFYFILSTFAEDDTSRKNLSESYRYIRNNWWKIRNMYRYGLNHGCSAEGHVSHILSARMSSRPLGWSKKGIDKVSKLRAYKANGMSLLDLAIYQRAHEERIEEDMPTAWRSKLNEKEYERMSDKYYELLNAHISRDTVRKVLSIREHIYTFS